LQHGGLTTEREEIAQQMKYNRPMRKSRERELT
jgi:hypothetical protein